ncbi:phosphonoacetaldehyde hydrolase [Dellaglioa sp. BT-FLS60]
MPQIKAVIFDWAGTTVDFGSIDPVFAFQKAFHERGMPITVADIRKDMGIEKHEHIAKLVQLPEIKEEWLALHHDPISVEDQQAIFNEFEVLLLKRLRDQTMLVPSLLETQTFLKKHDIKIGTTTGYTQNMLSVVAEKALALGYHPDMIVSKEDVGEGRPSPLMIQSILSKFKISNPKQIIKVGDTIIDIAEGKNANVISVGVVESSSLIGLTLTEFNDLPSTERASKIASATQQFKAAGADYIILNLTELPALIEKLN